MSTAVEHTLPVGGNGCSELVPFILLLLFTCELFVCDVLLFDAFEFEFEPPPENRNMF
jgi:hypothetical protein